MPTSPNEHGQPQTVMNGYSQHAASGVVASNQTSPAVSTDQVLSPPLPMGYYDGLAQTQAVAPPPAEKFLLPSGQLDKVVSEILSPFGFEERQIEMAPPPPPPPAPPPPAPLPPPPPPPAPPVPQVSAAPQQVQPTAPPAMAAHVGTGFGFTPTEMPHSVGEAPPPQPEGRPDPGPTPEFGVYADIPSPVETTRPAAASIAQMSDADVAAAELRLSMSELAREIIAVSEDEPTATSPNPRIPRAPEDEAAAVPADDGRSASFDLVLGPPQKGGKLRRSKPAISQERFLDPEGLVPNGEYGDSETPEKSEKGRSKGRLRLRS